MSTAVNMPCPIPLEPTPPASQAGKAHKPCGRIALVVRDTRRPDDVSRAFLVRDRKPSH